MVFTKCYSQANSSAVRLLVFSIVSICQNQLICSSSWVLVIDAWKAWMRFVAFDDWANRFARIQPKRVFWRVGCPGEILICPTQRIWQNSSAPTSISMLDDTWNWGSANSIFRGISNALRFREKAVTKQLILMLNELMRDCNAWVNELSRICAVYEDIVTMLFISEMEIFESCALTLQLSVTFRPGLEIRQNLCRYLIMSVSSCMPCNLQRRIY